MQQKCSQGEYPRPATRNAFEQPPKQHGEGSIVLAAVLIGGEGNQGVGLQAGEDTKEIIIAEKRGCRSEIPSHG